MLGIQQLTTARKWTVLESPQRNVGSALYRPCGLYVGIEEIGRKPGRKFRLFEGPPLDVE